ncbi:MAG: hypothetical protein RRY12_12220 [Cloacibacillus sp.]
MDLKSLASEFLNRTIKNSVEHTGMADSTRANTISFLDNPKFAKDINKNLNISVVLVREEDAPLLHEKIEAVIVEKPKAALFGLHNEYCKQYLKYGENKIAPSASIHPLAYIAPNGVTIGENVVIAPNAVILAGVEIGDNTTIGPNCVIGEDGFHVFEDLNKVKRIVCHDGFVKIGSNVDIQASVTVDKGFMGRDTVIGDECKIDNFVHIAHRVHVGARTLFAGGTSVGGSTYIGNNVWIGSKCTISNRLTIGSNARVLIGAVVIRNLKENDIVSGNFAMPHQKHLLESGRFLLES